MEKGRIVTTSVGVTVSLFGRGGKADGTANGGLEAHVSKNAQNYFGG